jgi:hypothetical protein
MTKTQFRLGVLVIFAAILLNNLTSPDRYKAAADTHILIDGVTGKTYHTGTTGWRGPLPKRGPIKGRPEF